MSQARTTSFNGWMLNVDLGELARDGRKIRLQDQPLRILEELLAHPGELVTREQLIARLWPRGVVDFDTSLNSAVRKLRIALQDDADTPRYIETVPRKGYRFIGTIDPPATPITTAKTIPSLESFHTAPPADTPAPPVTWHKHPLSYVAAGMAALLLAGLTLVGFRREPVTPPATASARLSPDSRTIAVLPFRTSARDETGKLLAQSVTELVRERLAGLEGLVVIASTSTSRLTESPLDTNSSADKLHARFLIEGGVERAGNQLRMSTRLIDAVSGAQLWSTVSNRSLSDVSAVLDEVAGRVADELRIPIEQDVGNISAPAHINLDAYQLYVRGQHLMSNQLVTDADTALELFRRATTLDPGFARGYLALAQAHILATILRGQDDATAVATHAQAETALRRALELNPSLGEAWIERARFTKDPVEGEQLFRKALRLAPNYGVGYMRYAEFLFDEYRKGEAIEMMDRARRIDPLTPRLHLRQAFFLMVSRSDIAGHDRLVREALAINPKLNAALIRLAHSMHEYRGEVAEGIRIIEQSIALDPQSGDSKEYAATMYLDVDDPVAAMAVLRDPERPSNVLVEIAQYRHDRRHAAKLARTWVDSDWSGAAFSPLADAIRDDAIATGDYASAIKLLESKYATAANFGPELRMWNRSLGLVYAHTLILAGETQRGRKLATAILVQIDSESVGRTENWFSRERAAAFAILGEDERALKELAASLKLHHYARWWYTAEIDPIYERLRRDPRFQAMAEQAKKHRSQQRAQIEQMRRKGEVPMRTTNS